MIIGRFQPASKVADHAVQRSEKGAAKHAEMPAASTDGIRKGEVGPSLIPEPTQPKLGTKLANAAKFKGTRLKFKEAFEPSPKAIAAKAEKVKTFDAELPGRLAKRDEAVRDTAGAAAHALGDKGAVLQTALAYHEPIKKAINPDLKHVDKRAVDGGHTLIDEKTGKPATFLDGVKFGAVDGLTNHAAKKAGMSVDEYRDVNKRRHLRAVADSAPAAKKAVQLGSDQRRLDKDAAKADKLDETVEKRAQREAGSSVVKGGTRYYDPVAELDPHASDQHVTRALQAELTPEAAFGAMNNERRLHPEATDASIHTTPETAATGSRDQAVIDQIAQRDRRAKELEQRFPTEHNAALQAWAERNDAQRGAAIEVLGGAAQGVIRTGVDKFTGVETHLGYNVGSGIGESVRPGAVAQNLDAQAKLDTKAGDFAKTHGELRDIRKQEAYEDLTSAQLHDGDVFFDAASSPTEIAAIDAKAAQIGNAALPAHNVLSENALPADHLGLIPSSLRDGAMRFFGSHESDQQLINSWSIPEGRSMTG